MWLLDVHSPAWDTYFGTVRIFSTYHYGDKKQKLHKNRYIFLTAHDIFSNFCEMTGHVAYLLLSLRHLSEACLTSIITFRLQSEMEKLVSLDHHSKRALLSNLHLSSLCNKNQK